MAWSCEPHHAVVGSPLAQSRARAEATAVRPIYRAAIYALPTAAVSPVATATAATP